MCVGIAWARGEGGRREVVIGGAMYILAVLGKGKVTGEVHMAVIRRRTESASNTGQARLSARRAAPKETAERGD